MLSKPARERFNKLLEGYTITNGIIAKKDRLVLITKNTGAKNANLLADAELTTEFLLYNPRYHKEKHGIYAKGWGKGIREAWGALEGSEMQSTIFCDRDNGTCEFNSDEKWHKNTGWQELPTPTNVETPMLRSILGCTKIENDIYMFGIFRKLYRRTGKQQWEDLTYELDHPNLHAEIVRRKKQKKSLVTLEAGFSCVDGFSKNDIYACGDGGDLWHYDGKIWQRLDPPTNLDLEAVLCAPDGYVYLAGASGTIIKGRYDSAAGEKWGILESPTTEIIHSLAWFQGKVYIGVEYGLYSVDKNEKVEEYQFPEPGPYQYSFRNVAACEEALLSYGANQALVFDGNVWEQIVGKLVLPIPEVVSNILND